MKNIIRGIEYRIGRLHHAVSQDFSHEIFIKYKKLFAYNDVKICYNKWIPADYDPKKSNILIAIESPEVILHNGWIKEDMKFIAEISFANFFKLDNYHCCRTLYSTNDNFVNLVKNHQFSKKELVSMVYSDKKLLKGHQFRHQMASKFADRIHLFGSGTEKKLKQKSDSLDSYYFQIVIENGKYPEYVSEKFFDCLKTKTIPVYWGGEDAIKKMGFDLNGIIFFDTDSDLENVLNTIVNERSYHEREESLEYNLKRLIEIRNEIKMSFYRNTVQCFYSHTTGSYLESQYNLRALNLD
jgi:hypothetical protein